MQPSGNECLAGLNAASYALAKTPLGAQRDMRRFGVLFVALFYGRLDGSKLFGLH